ncbi:MAG TPA: HPr family phosphocarrier protein [Thermomicrobiales bacterium]|jgi:phosphotransferase system HPr (HPr) family protein|nr:HPr family phosphocarrier protein [Thermomicrobiales bacterium]
MSIDEVCETTLAIDHPAGLHLRPAALFVRTANGFQSAISLRNLSRDGARAVDAKSIVGVMQAAVSQGHRVAVRASGPDAAAAVTALTALVARNFAEEQ